MKRRTQLSNTIRSHAAEFGLVVPKGSTRSRGCWASLPRTAVFRTLPRRCSTFSARSSPSSRPGWRRSSVGSRHGIVPTELGRRLVEVPTIQADRGVPAGDQDHRPQGLRQWPNVRRLDRPDAQGPLDRRKAEAGGHHPRRRRKPARHPCRRHLLHRTCHEGRIQPSPWLADLLRRKPRKLVAVALANKTARIAWRLMVSGQRYDPNHVPAKRPATLTRGEPIAIAA